MIRHQSVFPEGLGIYQNRMPLYINCTEVTNIYTNGSYQLVYQNSTPVFVHTKQVLYILVLKEKVILNGRYIPIFFFFYVLPTLYFNNLPLFFRSVQWAEEVGRGEEVEMLQEETEEQVWDSGIHQRSKVLLQMIQRQPSM